MNWIKIVNIINISICAIGTIISIYQLHSNWFIWIGPLIVCIRLYIVEDNLEKWKQSYINKAVIVYNEEIEKFKSNHSSNL